MSDTISSPDQSTKEGPSTQVEFIKSEIARMTEFKYLPSDHDDPDLAQQFVRGLCDGGPVGPIYNPKTREVERPNDKWNPAARSIFTGGIRVRGIQADYHELNTAGENISDALAYISFSPDKKLFSGIDWVIAGLATPEGQSPRNVSAECLKFIDESVVERRGGEVKKLAEIWKGPLPELALELAKRLQLSEEEINEITSTESGLAADSHPTRIAALKNSINLHPIPKPAS